jgi:hypothetical protein
MKMKHRSLLAALALTPALALAQAPDFGGLAGPGNSGDNRSGAPVAGRDYPMLEFDSQVRILADKSIMYLHQNGERRYLGILDQNAGMALHDAYRFRSTEESAEAARIDFIDFSADIGVKIKLTHPGLRGEEIGRIRQRALFSVGTGIDVYTKNNLDRKFGYIDQKAGRTLVDELVRGIASYGFHTPDKVYVFNKVTYRAQERRTMFGRTKTEYVPTNHPVLTFVTGRASGTGPGGVFLDQRGQPVLAIKGDWWVSQNVFDLLVRRVDNEGTAGKLLRGGLAVLQALDGDTSGAADTVSEGQEFVRNSSAYLGSFLVGIIYFPDFRELVGIDLPIAMQ